MRITPELVIESLPRAQRTGYLRPGVDVARITSILSQSVLFQFPDVPSVEEHCAFAVDLYERGLFRLPFPATAVAIERDLGPPHGRRGAMIVLIEQADNKIGAVSCSEVDDHRRAAMPIGICVQASFSRAGENAWDVHGNSLPLVSDEVMRAMYGGDGKPVADTMHERLMNNVLNAMGLVVMLMSKGVSTELVVAPEKLNRARVKRGKPQIGERYVVSLDLHDTRTICNSDGSTDDITGHTRGSPRPHWRRGHFRTLNRGGEAERVIPVAPALIAANASSPVTRAVYAIKEPAQ